MRILFVSDLHYALKQFDWLAANAANYDFVSLGGDLLDLGSALDFDVQIVVVEKYLNTLRQKTCLLVSSGNHDGDSRNEADESVADWLSSSRAENLYVDNDSFVVGDTLFTICPWWDGPFSRTELEALLTRESTRVRGRWIWIHHAPPAGSRVSWTGKKMAGDDALREWIERFKPDMVLCGHIHNSPFYADGGWFDRIGGTWVFNPGRQIGECPAYISLDLDDPTAEWISIEGRSVQRLALADC